MNLGESDGAACDAAVGMEDGIMAVLPALILQALVGQTAIFDKSVAIAVAMRVDPAERRIDIRQYLFQKGNVKK